MPLDDLVGAPEVGDPRIRLKPGKVKGRTVLPLTRTRRHAGVEDRHPDHAVHPEPRTHDGYEWLYVLSGRMRLVLGDQDLVLGAGEAAEFDTTRAALVRQHRRRTGRDAEHLRPTR